MSAAPSYATASWRAPGAWSTGGSSPDVVEGQFLVYSVTKMVIAAIAMRLVERGQLVLDAPVVRHLPWPELGQAVTLRHLLGHTSGLPDYGGLPDYHQAVRLQPSQPWTHEEFRRRKLTQPSLFAPGAGWAYSNPGYLVVRLLLEAVTGASLRELVQAEVAEPLGLQSTTVVETPADLAGLVPAASTLLSADGQPALVPGRYHPGWVTHGVLASTAGDVVRFALALMQGRLVGTAAVQEMLQTRRVPGDHPPWREPSYGLGLMADPGAPGGPVHGHTGGGSGYTAAVFARGDGTGPVQVECALCAGDRWAADRLVLARLGIGAAQGA